MPRVLLIGLKPEAVDYTDPDIPPGTTEEKIAAGIETAISAMRQRGWEAEFCGITPDAVEAEKTIVSALSKSWDCVVIGGGIRMPRKSLLLFEHVVNVIHTHATTTPIAFNTSPDNTPEAAARWLKR